jgi:hypothetical protein
VVEQPIRNRQVASSTLALGSTFSISLRTTLAPTVAHQLHTPLLNDVGLSHAIAQRIERHSLRFVHALDVDVHGEREC